MISYTIVVINMLYTMFTGNETPLITALGDMSDKFQLGLATVINAVANFLFVNR